MVKPAVQAAGLRLNEAEFDRPEFEGPGTDYVICSVPRSGSTLLAYLMRACGRMGVPHEYLQPNVHLPVLARRLQLVGKDGTVNVEAYLHAIRKRRTTANGVFGVKLHFSQLAPLVRNVSVVKWIRESRLIRIRRRDLVGQAISYYTAQASGVWSAVDMASVSASPTPVYDGASIARYLRMIEAEDKGWDTFFAAEGLRALDIWYEDLIADADSVCKSVCAHVGVDPAYAFDIGSIGLKRLASQRSAEWKERFRAEHADLLQGATHGVRS